MSADPHRTPGPLARLSAPIVSYTALAALVGVAATLAAFGPDLSGTALLVLYAAAFLPYAVLLTGAAAAPLAPVWYVGAAAAARFPLLFARPVLSDDIYRYVWDGRVGHAGINPFAHPPAADTLAPLRDPSIWPRINHPEVPTIYPPGAQYLFELNAALGGGVPGLKMLFVAVEVAAVAIAWRWLRDAFDSGTLLFALAAYALNPLVFLEVAWSGHLDVVAWGLLVAGLVAWQFGESVRSGFAAAAMLGASSAVKFLGLAALPLILFDDGDPESSARPRWQRVGALAVALGILVASYLPFAGAGGDLFSGFGTYADSWRGNDGGYRLVHETTAAALEAWNEPADPSSDQILFDLDALDGVYRTLGWTKEWNGKTIPDTTYSADELAAIVGKAAAAGTVGLTLLWCLLLGYRPLEGTALLLLVLYLFAPIVHPWYVAWLVPFAALRARATGLWFSFTVLAAYLAWRSSELGGPWHVPTWAVSLEYGSVLLAFWLESACRPPVPTARRERESP